MSAEPSDARGHRSARAGFKKPALGYPRGPMKTETAPRRAILPVTIGTAGHVDHGKTSLVRALAGGNAADVDRLAEEQERGLTIDVGYAELTLGDGLEVG